MPSECHSFVRAPAIRVTRVNCGVPGDVYVTARCFTDITLTKVMQDRQDALGINANGDICVDKPKHPQLRWYEVVITFLKVDPELFNLVSNEPLVYNDALTPQAVGWCTLPDSSAAAEFGLEFWTGTEEENCVDGTITYGYGLLPRITQGMIGDVTLNNDTITFTVTGITRAPNAWGTGPYNVIINETGGNAGFPGPLLLPVPTAGHKCVQWTTLGPPPEVCGLQDITPLVVAAPLAGVAPLLVTLTFPLGGDGLPILPAVIDWGDGTPEVTVTTGVDTTHSYTLAGTYNATYRPLGYSAPTYTSDDIVVT